VEEMKGLAIFMKFCSIKVNQSDLSAHELFHPNGKLSGSNDISNHSGGIQTHPVCIQIGTFKVLN
jgi:hypothetical protein